MTQVTHSVHVSADERATQQYYEELADVYERDRGPGYHQLIDDLEMQVAEPLVAGKKVLEVGCGPGFVLRRLAGVATEAWGVDLSPRMVERARQVGLNAVEGRANALPFESESFDVVCSFKMLAHVSDIGNALAEMSRVTRRGGHMILEFYNPVSLRYLAKRIGGPRRAASGRSEEEVFTRWDAPWTIPRILPPGTELAYLRGVRVWTPFAAVHRIPYVREVFAAVESAAVNSAFRYFGGLLIAVARRSEHSCQASGSTL